MLAVAAKVHFRISRSKLLRERALRRILRSERNIRRQFGGAPVVPERRHEIRHALRVPIHLHPVQARGLSAWCDPEAVPYLAITRNISLYGVGFDHDAPLPQSKLMVEFDVATPEPLVMLVEVRWTLQQNEFSYRSGGRVLGICRRA